jgi:tetratricopeptide (TPR) repeat protein
LLCELGILGFIFWVWFWVAVFSTAWRGLVHGRNFGERFFVLTIFASMVCINIAASFSFPFHKIQTGGLIFMLIGVLGFIRHRQMHPPAPPAAAKKPRQPMKNPKKARAKAPSRATPPAAVSVPEPDIGEYESYHRPPALRMLKGLVFAVALLLTALGMYTQIQHFRSNTFFSWGTRFISAKYSNDYNSSRDFWFKRATELNPSNGRAEFFWGWATSKTEQYVEAAELLRHAQGLYPQTDTHYTLGLTLTWHGNKLMAEGNEAEGMRKYNEAIDALMFASQRLPTRLEYYTELVKLLNRLGRFEEAEKYSERAITVYQWVTMAQNVEYMFYLWKGQALIAQDKIDEAIETLEEATTLVYDKLPPDRKGKPVSLSDQPQAYLLLGQAYEKKGDFENAEYHYNKYLTKNNNLKKEQRANDILFFQGRLFEKMGDVEPDEESKLKYKDWAEQKYVLLVKLYDDFERFKEKIGSERPSSQRMTEFTSKNGRPISEKIYRESLSGLERIKAGEPYPAMEEMVLIESETVGVGEAELVKLDED